MSDTIESIDKQVAELLAKKQSIIDKEKEIKLAEVKKIIQQFGFTSIDLGLSNAKKKSKLKIKYEYKYIKPIELIAE